MLRYPPLSAENYIRNRADFAEAMSPGAMALFSSNDIYPTSADGTLQSMQLKLTQEGWGCASRPGFCRQPPPGPGVKEIPLHLGGGWLDKIPAGTHIPSPPA